MSKASFLLRISLPVFLAVGWLQAQAGPEPLQFTAKGHVLAFSRQGVVTAALDHALRVDFVGARGVRPEGEAAGEPARKGEAPPFGKVTYMDAWPGITVTFEASPGCIAKSTYTVQPGGRASDIRLRYHRPVALDGGGNLRIAFERGTMTEVAPVAWQDMGGRRVPVKVVFALHGPREVGFALGAYRRDLPLVIDPDISWHSFLGGINAETSGALVVDASGNVFVTGFSQSWGSSPVRAYTGGGDACVVKLNASGVQQWMTFLGGAGADYGHGLALDAGGNVLVSGYSDATWGTAPKRAYSALIDAWVARLNSSGVLQWHTFLGGVDNDFGRKVAVDGSGNVYMGGRSAAAWGAPLRAFDTGDDGWVAKLNSSGVLQWHTFLGGAGTGDRVNGLTLDGSGNVVVVGTSSATWGSPVRVYKGSTDIFVAKLDANGGLTWNTFLGGTLGDIGDSVVTGASDAIFVGGGSSSTTSWSATPIQANAGGGDGVVCKLDSAGVLSWHTFLGGTGADYVRALTLDLSGNIIAAGESDTTWGTVVSRPYTDLVDGFVAKLGINGYYHWNTFLGSDQNDYCYAVDVDGSDNILASGESSATWMNGATSPLRAYTGSTDAFVAKLANPFTAISLASLEALPGPDRITLAWRTGTEFEHAGFHVWRASHADGPFSRQTAGLIPARGVNLGGAAYEWVDSGLTPGQTWFYKLEDVDLHGVGTFHGPVSATAGQASGIQAFTATPPSLFLGGGSWLSWAASGSVTLNGNPVGGARLWVAPTTTTAYTLADGAGASRLLTLTVRPFALKDLAGLARAWGSAKGAASYDPVYDLNGDGRVDDLDAELCLKP